MIPSAPAGPIRPDHQTPRTFGLLNLVYAAGLMACGFGQNLLFATPALVGIGNLRVTIANRQVSGPPPSVESTARADVPDFAARLESLEAATTDPKTKPMIAALRRREAMNRTAPAPPTLTDELVRDPRVVGHIVFDLLTGLFLNLLMLASGVGLLLAKGWGRFLAVGVAWLKITRLGILALSMTFIAAPAASAMLLAIGNEAADQSVIQSFRSLLMAFSWGLFVVGSIYPALTIWFLSRPSVHAGFVRDLRDTAK